MTPSLLFPGPAGPAGSWTSVLASIWLVGGIVISCLGVVGIYPGRVFTEIKQRPHHIVAEQINAPEAETALHSRDAGS